MLDPRGCHRASILRHGPLWAYQWTRESTLGAGDADGQGARYGSRSSAMCSAAARQEPCFPPRLLLLCPSSSVTASQLLVSRRKRTRRVVYAASVARAVEGGGCPSFEAAGKG